MELFTIARKNNSGAIAWTEEQVRYIIYHYVDLDETLKSLAQDFKVQPQAIRNLLRKNNVDITSKKKRGYPRDSNYFSEINTPEKAYWYGVLLSDGTISSENKVLGLSLKDREHVEKFKNAIGAINHKITESKDTRWSKECFSYLFSIGDEKLVNDLNSLGMVSNKTYKGIPFPNFSDELMPHFIRGYFDGDGCISYQKNQKKYYISWVGSYSFLTSLKEYLGKENLSLSQNSVSKITYELRISGKKDVLRILHMMYDNSTEATRLNRKYERVLDCYSLGASPLNLDN